MTWDTDPAILRSARGMREAVDEMIRLRHEISRLLWRAEQGHTNVPYDHLAKLLKDSKHRYSA